MSTITFLREKNPQIFDHKYYPDGNKIVNEWFERTQQKGLSWPEGKHNHLIKFTGDTDRKFNNLSKNPQIVDQYKSAVRYNIFNYLKDFNDKGFDQIVGTKGGWTLDKSIEGGMKQAVQTLVNQAFGKRTYYSTDSRRPDGKFVGYGTRGGKRRKKKTRRKRGGAGEVYVGSEWISKYAEVAANFVGVYRVLEIINRDNKNHIIFFKIFAPNPLYAIDTFLLPEKEFLESFKPFNSNPGGNEVPRKMPGGKRRKKKTRRKRGSGPCLSKLCKNKEKERLLKRKESRKRFGSIPEEFDDMIDNWERFSNESRMEVEHSPPEIKSGLINDPFRNLVVRKGGGDSYFDKHKKIIKKFLEHPEVAKKIKKHKKNKLSINQIMKKITRDKLNKIIKAYARYLKSQKGGKDPKELERLDNIEINRPTPPFATVPRQELGQPPQGEEAPEINFFQILDGLIACTEAQERQQAEQRR